MFDFGCWCGDVFEVCWFGVLWFGYYCVGCDEGYDEDYDILLNYVSNFLDDGVFVEWVVCGDLWEVVEVG